MTRPVTWLVDRLIPITLTAALVVVIFDIFIWRA